MTKRLLELVIAHFDEDLSWLGSLDEHVSIYLHNRSTNSHVKSVSNGTTVHRDHGVSDPKAPLLGQDNDEVLSGILGMDEAEITALYDTGTIRQDRLIDGKN